MPVNIDKNTVLNAYRQFGQWTKVAGYLGVPCGRLIRIRKRLGIFRSQEENNIVCPIGWRSPKSSNQNQTNHSISFRATITKEKLLAAYEKFGQWQRVAEFFSVTHAYVIKARKWLGIFTVTPTSGRNYGGINSKYYKGKYLDSRGYVVVNRYHPENTKDHNTYEHILVVEKHFGKELKPGELIHHIDGNKSNNDIMNLFVCNHSSHRQLESQLQNIGYQLVKAGIIIFDHVSGKYILMKDKTD